MITISANPTYYDSYCLACTAENTPTVCRDDTRRACNVASGECVGKYRKKYWYKTYDITISTTILIMPLIACTAENENTVCINGMDRSCNVTSGQCVGK